MNCKQRTLTVLLTKTEALEEHMIMIGAAALVLRSTVQIHKKPYQKLVCKLTQTGKWQVWYSNVAIMDEALSWKL
jgi:hypothetical protein